jgi:CMP-N,N'-diacetyllegionaminic acid synthase
MKQEYKVVAIVPARGGSRSVPRKNIKLMAGKPMIAYTLDAARACPAIARTIVSTEDEEIAEVARGLGAEVPFLRPMDLAGDAVTDLPVFHHALDWLARNEGLVPDIVVHLRPTAPLRRAEHIEQGLKLLIESGADSARSVCRAGQHPYKMWRFDDGWLSPYIKGDMAIPEAYNMPRQKLPPAYVQNGSVDVAWRRTIMELNSMTGARIAGFEMPELDSVNVDSPMDFLFAELILSRPESRNYR